MKLPSAFALLSAICLSSFFGSFMSASLNVALPAIAADYGTAPESVSAAVTAYVIGATAGLLPAAALAAVTGYARAYRAGVLASALLALCVPLVPLFAGLVTLRALLGCANAIIFCTANALVGCKVRPEKRGQAFGITVAAVYAGLALSPGVSGLITELAGWRTVFYLSAAGYALALLLLRQVSADGPYASTFPFGRMLCCFCGLGLLLYAISATGTGDSAAWLTLPALCLLAAYLHAESRSDSPVLAVGLLLQNRVLTWALLGAVCNYAATFAVALCLAMHLELIRDLSAAETGLVLMLQPALQCVLSPLAGRLTVKISPHLLAFCGMGLCTLALMLFTRLGPDSPLLLVFAGQVLCGCGFALFSSPNTVIIMSRGEQREMAVLAGLQALARNLGMSLCMAALSVLLGMMISAESGTALYVRELSFTLSLAFAICAAAGCAGMLCCALSARASRSES